VFDPSRRLTPVEVVMKVSTKYSFNLRRDSVTSLETAGVLGETYLDIDSAQAVGVPAKDGDTLTTRIHPDFNEVVRSSQSTLQNMDALLLALKQASGRPSAVTGNFEITKTGPFDPMRASGF
jgi:phospholipid/cholesterol/gamma-HCH transport system substrate-binding protein